MSRIQMSILESYLWEAANVLRGHMGAAEYKQYIFPMLFWKRISDTWDEECKQAISEVGADFPKIIVSKFLKMHTGKPCVIARMMSEQVFSMLCD